MRRLALRLLSAACAAILLAPAVKQVETVIAILRARFACPLDIEFLEGAHIYHAWRMAQGLPLYVDWTTGFATLPYPPLYWVAVRAAFGVFGFTDQAGRAVSIASLIVAASVLSFLAAKAAPNRLFAVAFAVIAAAGICTGYPCCGGAYDIVRSDMMSMALVVVGAALAGDGRLSSARAWAVAVALSASIYTKQTGVVFSAWVLWYALRRDARGGLHLLVAMAVLCGVPFVILEAMTRGWFATWLFYPFHHGLRSWLWIDSVAGFIQHAPFLLVLPWLVPELHRRRWLDPTTSLWTGMLIAAMVSSALAFMKGLSWRNVWMPELLLAWPVGLMLLGDALHGLGPRVATSRFAAWGSLAVLGGVLASFHYDVASLEPTADRWSAAKALDDLVRSLDGGVVVTTDPMAAVRAGKGGPQPFLPAYDDAKTGGLPTDYVAALVTSGARWVITTDRYRDTDRAPEPRMPPFFERVRTLDFSLRSLSSWDTAGNAVLWRRR
jgi:hypothetical protein